MSTINNLKLIIFLSLIDIFESLFICIGLLIYYNYDIQDVQLLGLIKLDFLMIIFKGK